MRAPNDTEGIVASPDCKRVAVAGHADPSVILIDTASDATGTGVETLAYY